MSRRGDGRPRLASTPSSIPYRSGRRDERSSAIDTRIVPLPTRPRSGPRLRWIALLTLTGIVLLAGVGVLVVRAQLDPGDPVAGVSAVAVRDDEFAPAAIEVPVGTTVTWRWEGEEEHNVVGDGLESPVQIDGEFAHLFSEPGTHAYECTLHFFMRGEVVVTE